MAGRGPAPKPAHLRQRTNRKVGAATIAALDRPDVPEIPNPDGRVWHPLTLDVWREMFESEMASQWLPTDVRGLGLIALAYDEAYKKPSMLLDYMREIRLQRTCYGLSPLDRSRLQWEVSRADEAEQKRPSAPVRRRTGTADPRAILMAVK